MIIILNNDEIFLSKTRGTRFTLLRINPRGHGVKHCKRRFFVVAVAIMQSVKVHSVHPLSFLLGGGAYNQIFKKRGSLTESQFLEGLCGEREGLLFSGGAVFT